MPRCQTRQPLAGGPHELHFQLQQHGARPRASEVLPKLIKHAVLAQSSHAVDRKRIVLVCTCVSSTNTLQHTPPTHMYTNTLLQHTPPTHMCTNTRLNRAQSRVISVSKKYNHTTHFDRGCLPACTQRSLLQSSQSLGEVKQAQQPPAKKHGSMMRCFFILKSLGGCGFLFRPSRHMRYIYP